MSRTFSAKNGSVESLKCACDAARDGLHQAALE
jgi:hypothetical protein